MRIILLLLIFPNISWSFAQTLSENKEEKYVAICKAVASIEDIHDTNFLCDYNNTKTLFILSKSEFIKDPDKEITIKLEKFNLIICFKKEIFFNNIPYWFELTEILEYKDIIEVKFRSYNSVNVLQKRTIIKGELSLSNVNGQYVVIKKIFNN